MWIVNYIAVWLNIKSYRTILNLSLLWALTIISQFSLYFFSNNIYLLIFEYKPIQAFQTIS